MFEFKCFLYVDIVCCDPSDGLQPSSLNIQCFEGQKALPDKIACDIELMLYVPLKNLCLT